MNKQNSLIFTLFLMGVFLVFTSSCKKDKEDAMIPILSTAEISKIGQLTAQCGGVITSDAGFAVNARGVCWNKSGNPTIKDNKTTDGLGAGSFTSKLTGLTHSSTYYVRAYATNSEGTAYGSTMIFETLGSTFIDSRDGNVYRMVTIGEQIWMAENLAYKPSSGNYWAYSNINANIETFGYLYDWQTALNVCPTGWHLPSDEEWTILIVSLGGESEAGGKLKEIGTTYWNSPNLGATNETGFSALPGGVLGDNGVFTGIGYGGNWWSSTEENAGNAYGRYMNYGNKSIGIFGFGKELGLSVRCLKD